MLNLDLSNANMNEIITLEEAEIILEGVKNLFPGIIDDVYVVENPAGYAYNRSEEGGKWIDIYPKCTDLTSRVGLKMIKNINRVGLKIIKHINNEFKSNFAQNLKTITINAFCHEIGHAIDFEIHKMLNDETYEDDAEEQYNYFFIESSYYYDELDDFENYAYENDIDVEHVQLDAWRKHLEEIEEELDRKYRMIITEYAADKFSAEFMNAYMKHIPQLFESKAIEN